MNSANYQKYAISTPNASSTTNPPDIIEIIDKCALGDPEALLYFLNERNLVHSAQVIHPIVKLHQRVSDNENTYAMYFLAQLYKFGNGVTKDLKYAHELANRAYEKGNLYGLDFLAFAYDNGDKITPRNSNKAIELYKIAADLGDPLANERLGEIYCEKPYVPQISSIHDYAKAIICFTKAANLGSRHAKKQLAHMYKKGHGVEQDFKAATWLYLEAQDSMSIIDTLKNFILSDAPAQEKMKIILEPRLVEIIKINPMLRIFKEAHVYYQIKELRRSLTEYTLFPVEIINYICDLTKA